MKTRIEANDAIDRGTVTITQNERCFHVDFEREGFKCGFTVRGRDAINLAIALLGGKP